MQANLMMLYKHVNQFLQLIQENHITQGAPSPPRSPYPCTECMDGNDVTWAYKKFFALAQSQKDGDARNSILNIILILCIFHMPYIFSELSSSVEILYYMQ